MQCAPPHLCKVKLELGPVELGLVQLNAGPGGGFGGTEADSDPSEALEHREGRLLVVYTEQSLKPLLWRRPRGKSLIRENSFFKRVIFNHVLHLYVGYLWIYEKAQKLQYSILNVCKVMASCLCVFTLRKTPEHIMYVQMDPEKRR